MKEVEVIIPWFPALADADREAAFGWVMARWTALGFCVAVAQCPAKRFCKAEAVAAALKRSRASWLILADADVVPPVKINYSLDKVRHDDEPWAKPYTQVYRLNRESSSKWYQGIHVDLEDIQNLTQTPNIGVPGGGIVILSREKYDQVPLDKRFVGWGGEDESWGYALHTIFGPPWISMSNLIHLWHEPQERMTRQKGSLENEALRSRYLKAISKVDKMQALVNEGKE